MKKELLILGLGIIELLFVVIGFHPREAFASFDSEKFDINFDNCQDLINNGWSVTGSINCEQSLITNTQVLKLVNGGSLKKNIDTSGESGNYIYEISIEFYDSMQNDVGFLLAINDSDHNSIGVGLNPSRYINEYYYRINNYGNDSERNAGIKRTIGKHVFLLRITSSGSYGVIDGINLSFLPWNGLSAGINRNLKTPNEIVLLSPWNSTNEIRFEFDNFKMDNYAKSYLLGESLSEVEKYYALLQVENGGQIFFEKLKNNLSSMTQDSGIARKSGDVAASLALRSKLNNDSCSSDVNLLLTDCDKVRNLLIKLITKQNIWGQKWLSTTITFPMTTASWLVWDKLDSNTRNLIVNGLNEEANIYVNRLNLLKLNPNAIDVVTNMRIVDAFSRCEADTTAEDNATAAMFLAAWSQMIDKFNIENKINYKKYEEAARVYGFHTLTLDESDSIMNLFSKTMKYENSEYFLENHGLAPSLNYSMALTSVASIFPFYRATDKQLPSEFLHNQNNLWNSIAKFINKEKFIWNIEGLPVYNITGGQRVLLSSETSVFGSGRDDWGGDLTWFNQAVLFSNNEMMNNSVSYSNLIKHEVLTRPDYLAFPEDNNLTLKRIDKYTDYVFYDDKGLEYIETQNAILAGRHLMAYLILNPDLLSQTNCMAVSQNTDINDLIRWYGAYKNGTENGDLNCDGSTNISDLVFWYGKYKK